MSVAAFQKHSLLFETSNALSSMTSGRLSAGVTTAFYRKRLSLTDSSHSTTLVASSSSADSPAQVSTYKFKNVEEMLHAFKEEPVLVYFTSVTCGPCKLQKKELANVRELVGAESAFKVISIDTKKWPHVGSKFAIGKLPCLLVMKNKEILLRLEGLTKAEELVEKVYSNASFNINNNNNVHQRLR